MFDAGRIIDNAETASHYNLPETVIKLLVDIARRALRIQDRNKERMERELEESIQ